MYHNNFSLRIVGGNEQQGGYVSMAHGQVYSLQMRSDHKERCDARVEIDGQHVGTWRIEQRRSINIDRPAHDTGQFTFYRLGSQEASQAALNDASPDLGLVKVTFTPEIPRPIYRHSGVVECARSMSFGNATLGAGGTCLSGQSGQEFGQAESILYDRSQETVIQLRLVHNEASDTPRPLSAHSTPYPPRLA